MINMKETLLGEIARVLSNLQDSGRVVELVGKAVSQGIPANTILEEGLRKGLEEVGRKYEQGEYFLSDLLYAASLMQDSAKVLEPIIKAETGGEVSTIVLGTVRGDIHDIGKNVFRMLCEASGFQVIDLGVDIDPETFVDKLKETGVEILAMSALLTTTIGEMKTVIEALAYAKLRHRVKVIIGGNAVTKRFGEEIGADGAALDAVEGVELCKKWVRKCA